MSLTGKGSAFCPVAGDWGVVKTCHDIAQFGLDSLSLAAEVVEREGGLESIEQAAEESHGLLL